MSDRVRVDLTGVPETLLWNLYHRATAARDANTLLDDPKAVELVERIDYPFGRFGDHAGRAPGWQAFRVRRFDDEVRRFLVDHPAGTVVALGEGLDTQFWRVDNGRMRWVTVDLPETIAVRERLLPDGPRQRTVPCGALEERWTEGVDSSHGVLVTAQGLLMYFEREDVDRLVELCARRFPGEQLLFDAVPSWMVRANRAWLAREQDGYRPPTWTWGMTSVEARRLAALPGVATLREPRLPRARGLLLGTVLPAMHRFGPLRYRLPVFAVLLARLAGEPERAGSR